MRRDELAGPSQNMMYHTSPAADDPERARELDKSRRVHERYNDVQDSC